MIACTEEEKAQITHLRGRDYGEPRGEIKEIRLRCGGALSTKGRGGNTPQTSGGGAGHSV